MRVNESVGMASRVISLALTHAELWGRFPSTHDWLYVFEDDVMLEPRLDQHSEEALHHLSATEKLASKRGSPMIYLDAPAHSSPRPRVKDQQISEQRSTISKIAATDGAMKRTSARLDFSIHPCAPLCTHAYAIRRQDAVGFYSNIRSHLERVGRFKQNFYGYSYYRYNIDVNLRGYFQTNRALAPLQWPTCIRMSGQGFTGLTSLIIQNASMPKVVGWHGAGPL